LETRVSGGDNRLRPQTERAEDGANLPVSGQRFAKGGSMKTGVSILVLATVLAAAPVLAFDDAQPTNFRQNDDCAKCCPRYGDMEGQTLAMDRIDANPASLRLKNANPEDTQLSHATLAARTRPARNGSASFYSRPT